MRVCAVVIGFLLAAPALPQCNQTPVLSDPFRFSMLDLAVDGNDLWAATTYGIALYDRSVDPPQLVASVPVPGTTRIVRLNNGYAYAGSGNNLVVIRKDGQALNVLRSVDAGAPINDIAMTPVSIFAATRNGIAQYSLLDPANPARTPAVFTTSQPAVSSLAIIGSTLYAADGDSSVASFDLTILQPLPTVTAPGNAVALHANNGKLLVSSLLQTTIFSGTTNVGTLPQGVTALAPISGDAMFVAGGDRTLRAIDLTTPLTPIDLFRDDLPATSGTVNRVNALAVAGGRLYVAAGDIGLVTYDVSQLAPFPVRGTAFNGATSIFSTGDKFYAAGTAGVTEFSPSLTQLRSWDGSRADVVRDGDGVNGFLLTSSGATMTFWTLISTIPQPIASTTFPAAVNGAVLIGTTAYAVLANGSLQSADFSQATPIPQPIVVPLQPSSIARSGTSIVLDQARGDGTTQLAFLASPSASAQSVTLPGLPTTPVTLSGSVAALQTFQGISLVDFSAGTTTLLPNSNDLVAVQLSLSGTTLLELTASTLRVWNTQSRDLVDEVTLPSAASAMNLPEGVTTAVVATQTDVVTVALDQLSRMPSRDLPPNANAYYKKIMATPAWIYLAGDRGIDIYSTAMHYRGSIRAAGIVDVAANDSGAFTIGSDMAVRAWATDGSPHGSALISEGSDAQALSIFAVHGAIWTSIIHGCSGGTCEKKTLIFDSNLNQTSSLTGGVIDVAISGNQAYAVTDFPSELRLIDVSDPLHPLIANSTGVVAPLSVAYANGTIYVLGDTLAAYTETDLTKFTDVLGTYTTDGTVTQADQHVRIDGNCAAITGRTFSPQLFSLPQWTPATSLATPSTARLLAEQPGTFYVLTDHSLEIWSSAPLPVTLRRHAAQ